MDSNGPDSNGIDLSEEAFQKYEIQIKNMLNIIYGLSKKQNMIDLGIQVRKIEIGKYIRSQDPEKELIPINSDEDFSPGSAFYMGGDLTVNETDCSFRINFFIDEEGNFQPFFTDDSSIDIDPEDTEDNITLTEKATKFIEDNWQKLVKILQWGIDIYLRLLKKG